jgi:hypothetical protein
MNAPNPSAIPVEELLNRCVTFFEGVSTPLATKGVHLE